MKYKAIITNCYTFDNKITIYYGILKYRNKFLRFIGYEYFVTSGRINVDVGTSKQAIIELVTQAAKALIMEKSNKPKPIDLKGTEIDIEFNNA